MTNYTFQVGGSLTTDTLTYVKRKADEELFQALKKGEFCYILNCRQMGKSSLLVRTCHLLQQEGYRCTTVDMSCIGSENITPLQWYKGVVTDLWRGLNLSSKVHLKSWWREEEDISLLQQLHRFIEEILFVQFPQEKIVIFIDEIDTILSLNFAVDDFFALIRSCYNRRAINPEYNRLTFAIFGVATPSDLIADKNRTPFNIGRAIELHGFQLDEAQPLVKALEDKFSHSERILNEILSWTGGQPFLSQKICNLFLNFSKNQINDSLDKMNSCKHISYSSKTVINYLSTIVAVHEEYSVEQLVYEHIICNWESQDEPQHLRTISNRILSNEQRAGRILSIYQLMLQGVEVKADDSREQIELLLSGLVVKKQGVLKMRNLIYQEVFNTEWVEKQLRNLRPYSQAFDAWVASHKTDKSRLLRGQALKDAQIWLQGKSLADLDYQFLVASQELATKEVEQALEAKRLKEVEARLIEERKRLAQEKKTAKIQRYLLGAVSTGLLIAVGLGAIAFQEYQRATLNEIKATVISSEALFASNRKFDALLQAIKAKQRLQKLGAANTQIETQIDKGLRQAIYELVESNSLSEHSAAVNGVAISPDGNTIASSMDNTVKLWRYDGTLLTTLKGHDGIVFRVKFSPQGNIIASSSEDNTVKLWKLDGTLITTLKGHKAPVWGIAFSPDSQTIASTSGDNTIKLWKLDGTQLMTLKGHNATVWGVAISPDGNTIASASADRTVKLWKRDGTQLMTLKGHNAEVLAVAISPDGNTIVSGSADNTVKLWRHDGTLLTTLKGHSAAVWGVAISPDGNTIASASQDRTVKLWKLDGTESMVLKGHSGGIWDVTFSPDGRTIATASADNTVKLWKPEATFLKILKGHSGGVWGVTFSPDGQTIATASADSTVKLWRRDGTLLTTLKGHSGAVRSVAFSPDGGTIATASVDKTAKLWRRDGTLLTTLKGHSGGVLAVVISPQGNTIATVSGDSTAKLWRRDGTLLTTLKGHSSALRSVAFSPDGGTIATASVDKTVKLWKLDGTQLMTLKGHSAGIWGVKFSPNGQMIATASLDKSVKLWKRDGTLLLTLRGDTGFGKVDFSPDSQTIASGGVDGSIKLWNVNGTQLTTLYGHGAMVLAVAFSPDSKTLATASDDQTVILWDLDRILNLDELAYGCHWVSDYLRTNAEVAEDDRRLCDDVSTQKASVKK
ncbi:hypothetical protein BZZ01_07065 [Nostocales cyanobacterium HT-58-2]|nr:hypothetical protein BZZ01_07065 [Nostocales cyanobacterium HT-58-2]